ncbi:MAG: 3-dehydroquinate synthase [Elusimicrobia bacterium]|nr:3-dehydroquinate synthase [Elusimicrobiota bacterium]
MNCIRVQLDKRSYDIRFGPLRDLPAVFSRLFPHRPRVLIVSSRAVLKAGHVHRLESLLKKVAHSGRTVALPNGEQVKNLETMGLLYKEGFGAGLDRKSVIVGLGGGVITDMAGFLAATYMRGVPFVSIPSTLLGMVDASIGGKTGVDVPEGKNLVGAFWQPQLVWVDSTLLQTLPEREWRTGFAEVIKYGVIKNRAFFDWLEKKLFSNSNLSTWSRSDIEKALYVSAQIKARVVSGDERETPLKGGREILNFGHTVGHALEAATGFHTLTHGEAISIGMVRAGRLALEAGLWSNAEQSRLIRVLQLAGLPIHFPTLTPEQKKYFWSALMRDKKNVAGSVRFVLPRKMGEVTVQKVVLSKRSF